MNTPDTTLAAVERVDEALVDQVARAMYADWPVKAFSTALVEATGIAADEPIPYDAILEAGGNHKGLVRMARSAVRFFATHQTDRAAVEALRVAEVTIRLDGERLRAAGMASAQSEAALLTVQSALANLERTI